MKIDIAKSNASSPYLPQSRIKDFLSVIRTNVCYRVWRRKLALYSGINSDTAFRMLDVGCGPGYFLRCAENWFQGCEITGLDSNKSLLDYAARRLKMVKLVAHDGQILPFIDGEFNVVSSLQVIEHLEDPPSFFREANRVLKPGGLLIIATPNPNCITAQTLGRNWHGYRSDHISLKTPDQWRKIMERAHFKILDDGTTGLTGFKVLQKLPFALINWIPLAMFGYFKWYKGESYMAIAKKV